MGRHILSLTLVLALGLTACEEDSPSEPVTPKGSLAVTVEGLPPDTDASITVQGPNGYQALVTETTTLDNLLTGSYVVTANTVTGSSATYTSVPAEYVRTVSANQTTAVTVTYAETSADNNLWIEGAYIAQSVQRFDGSVPLVAGREALLRVFVRATKSEVYPPLVGGPPVRVRLYDGQTLSETIDVPAPGLAVSSSIDESDLASSWNLDLTPAQITPGLRILIEIDPDNAFEETDESDNRFPASGDPQDVSVWDLGELEMRFIPVHQSANGLTGDVSTANADDFMEPIQQMMPIPSYTATVRSTYTTSLPALMPQDENGSWGALLNELSTLRTTEETIYNRHWYGVVDCDYGAGVAGIAYVGGRSGLGRQLDSPAFLEILPHEYGHNLNRQHSACGTVGQHPDYPHPNGQIGAYGYDLVADTLYPPTTPDVMGYCSNTWISDYTFENAARHRSSVGKAPPVSGPPAPCLLVWGRIDEQGVTLEPAFQITATPREPSGSGPHRLELRDAGGHVVYAAAFQGTEVTDLPRGSQTHFSFLIPVETPVAVSRIESAAGTAERRRPAVQAKAPRPAIQATPGGVRIEWDDAAHAMVMVTDRETGQVLSFARNGAADIATASRGLGLHFSDGVASVRQDVTVR